jgi:hypothetical protein
VTGSVRDARIAGTVLAAIPTIASTVDGTEHERVGEISLEITKPGCTNLRSLRR